MKTLLRKPITLSQFRAPKESIWQAHPVPMRSLLRNRRHRKTVQLPAVEKRKRDDPFLRVSPSCLSQSNRPSSFSPLSFGSSTSRFAFTGSINNIVLLAVRGGYSHFCFPVGSGRRLGKVSSKGLCQVDRRYSERVTSLVFNPGTAFNGNYQALDRIPEIEIQYKTLCSFFLSEKCI